MNRICSGGKKGTVVVIILGLISVMLIFIFGVTKRMSGQTQILTANDTTQIARLYLESYAVDVLKQLRAQINEPESEAYQTIRSHNGREEKAISAAFYKTPSDLLKEIELQYAIQRESDGLDIKLLGAKSLGYPKVLVVKNDLERKGFIRLTCKASFEKRKYKITLHFPYKVVMLATPLLKDFVFFSDQISVEQPEPVGEKDELNTLLTENSDTVDPSTNPDEGGKPWIFNGNPSPAAIANGNIFLGKDTKSLFFNLAGENKNRRDYTYVAGVQNYDPGVLCDLWQIKGKYFPGAKEGNSEERGECFVRENGDPVALRGLKLGTKIEDNDAFLYFLGFSSEISQSGKGHFAGTDRSLEDFLEDDPAFKKYSGNRKLLGYSATLKLLGENKEIDETAKALSDPEVPRFIYGNVFSRFLLISFFKTVSGRGAVKEIPYSNSPTHDIGEFPKFDGTVVKFEPNGPYQKYMSRVVSNGDPNDQKAYALSANRVQGPNPKGPAHSKSESDMNLSLGAQDYLAPDGLTMDSTKGGFDKFAPDWMFAPKAMAAADMEDKLDSSLYSRITRVFNTRADFENYAFRRDKNNAIEEVRLEGVIYVNDSICFPPGQGKNTSTDPNDPGQPGVLSIPSDKILGGIVIAKGKIKVGAITRGIILSGPKDKDEETVDKFIMETQDQKSLITLISLKPTLSCPDKVDQIDGSIEFSGNSFFGIHAVALYPQDLPSPKQMVKFTPADPDKPIWFVGGLAVSSPYMKKQVKGLSQPLYIKYLPAMTANNPDTRALVSTTISDYAFFVD